MYARKEDNVIIVPPNRVYKGNDTAVAIIQALKNGKSIRKLPIPEGEPCSQVHSFFTELRSIISGDTPAGDAGIERIPYTFSYTTLPVLGEIAVTYRCNNRCTFCYAGCGPCSAPPDTGREMTLKEIQTVIDVFRSKAKIPFFSFTGGEPLLRKDLEPMIRYARSRGFRVNLITNATLADRKRARKLFRAGLRTAQVSIEGTSPEEHDLLTGKSGSFKETLKGIRFLQKAGIRVQTNTTINGINRAAVVALPLFLKDLGIDTFAMNLYIPGGNGDHVGDLFLSYSDIGPIVDQVRKKAQDLGLTFYWYSPVPYCWFNPVARGFGNKSCAAMDGLISVSPSGNVLPCSSYPESMGSLLTKDFEDVWFSRRARYFKNKKFAPEECTGCDRFSPCQGACPLYWEYKGTSELKRRNVCARVT